MGINYLAQSRNKLAVTILILFGVIKVFNKLRSYTMLQNIDVKIHTLPKVRMILIEMHTQFTPYFIHYHQQLVNLKKEYGQANLTFQKSMHTKIQKMLLEKIDEIQKEIIIEKYQISSVEAFKRLVMVHRLQEEERLLSINISKLFPAANSLAVQGGTGLESLSNLSSNPPSFELPFPREILTK